MMDEHTRAVRSAPPYRVAGGPSAAAQSPPEDDERESKSGSQRRKCCRMTKRIGTVQHRRRVSPQATYHLAPDQKVPDLRLTAGNQFVAEYVPWTRFDASVAQQGGDVRCALRPHGEIVLEHDRLAIEQKSLARLRRGVEQVIDEPHEAQAEFVHRVVPLAIPVRVRDDEHVRDCRHARNTITPQRTTP